nr:hypothetical protein [uncultured bacterium]
MHKGRKYRFARFSSNNCSMFSFTYSHCHSRFFSSKEIKYFIWRHSPSLFPTMHPFV